MPPLAVDVRHRPGVVRHYLNGMAQDGLLEASESNSIPFQPTDV